MLMNKISKDDMRYVLDLHPDPCDRWRSDHFEGLEYDYGGCYKDYTGPGYWIDHTPRAILVRYDCGIHIHLVNLFTGEDEDKLKIRDPSVGNYKEPQSMIVDYHMVIYMGSITIIDLRDFTISSWPVSKLSKAGYAIKPILSSCGNRDLVYYVNDGLNKDYPVERFLTLDPIYEGKGRTSREKLEMRMAIRKYPHKERYLPAKKRSFDKDEMYNFSTRYDDLTLECGWLDNELFINNNLAKLTVDNKYAFVLHGNTHQLVVDVYSSPLSQWDHRYHRYTPKEIQDQVEIIMLCYNADTSQLSILPPEILYEIFKHL